MRILVSGSSGFVGRSVVAHFSSKKHEVVPLLHGIDAAGSIVWIPESGSLEDSDAVIHLAGEPLAPGRWTEEKKRKIFESRSLGTTALSKALAGLRRPPSVFISASAIGYYGDRGEELLNEGSAPGKGFLPHTCIEWENGSRAIENRGARTVRARFGVVIGRGGALAKMALPFRFGLGARMGTGEQWVSWISLADLVLALGHIIKTDSLHGPVNLVSPHPVRQKDFARMLAAFFHRPAFLSIPSWLLRLIFGDFAKEALLAGARAVPKKLEASGYSFRYPDLPEVFEKSLFH